MEKLLCHFVQTLPAIQGKAPEWIHLLPAGIFSGDDGRGPFVANDLQAIIEASNSHKLYIDENHSSDLVAAKGAPSPARGWIVEMQAREDGIWGRVEWTGEGEKLVSDRAYGFISPVFLCTKTKPHKIMRITSASLVNEPNLSSLKSLHGKKNHMDKELLELLGLESGADNSAVLEAVKVLNASQTEVAGTLSAVRTALEVDEDANSETMVTVINARGKARATDDNSNAVKGLEDQIKVLNTQITTLSDNTARDKAEIVVDDAINAGKLVPTLRDHMIARHMKASADVEKEIEAMPSINAGGLGHRKIDDTTTISGADDQVCQMMGLDTKEFAKTAKEIRSAH